MTAAPNNLKIPDYLELVDSSDITTLQTSKDKYFDDDKPHGAPVRPLPMVSEALGQKPPYYNESSDSEVNKSLSSNIRAAGKRPSYVEVPYLQTSPEINSYSQLNSVLDDYDILADVQRPPVPNGNKTPSQHQADGNKTPSQHQADGNKTPSQHLADGNKTQSQHQADVVSKKCVALSVCCLLVALLVVLAATLIAVLVARDQIEHSIDTELSSLRKLQDEMNKNVLDTVQSILGSREKASDLTVLYADSCYCLYRKQRSWKDAKDFCLTKGNGVHLAEIYKREENDFLMRILQPLGTNQGIWLGGSDLDKEGVWVWNYTGKPIELFEPTQWLPNQPSSTNRLLGEEDCLDVYNWDFPTFKWNDNACGDVQPFLCKSPLTQSRCFC